MRPAIPFVLRSPIPLVIGNSPPICVTTSAQSVHQKLQLNIRNRFSAHRAPQNFLQVTNGIASIRQGNFLVVGIVVLQRTRQNGTDRSPNMTA